MCSWVVQKVVQSWGKNGGFLVLWAMTVVLFPCIGGVFALQCDLIR